MRRRFVAIASLSAIALAVTGCAGSERAYGEASRRAEAGLASALEYMSHRASAVIAGRAAVTDVTAEDIAQAFINDLRQFPQTGITPQDNLGLYDLASGPEGEVRFSVFISSSSYSASGFISTNQTRYSCGVLSGRFGADNVAVGDAECPSRLKPLIGSDAVAVSLLNTAEKFDVQIGAG